MPNDLEKIQLTSKVVAATNGLVQVLIENKFTLQETIDLLNGYLHTLNEVVENHPEKKNDLFKIK